MERVISARMGQIFGVHARILEKRRISLRRLREGGVEMLAARARNHQRAI